MNSLKGYQSLLVPLASLLICYGIWPYIVVMTSKEIQPIASAISTITGVLFGFVMASITLFASAKDNTLVKNTSLTGYLPKLVNKLHLTMGALLVVCLVFLVVLFIPDSLEFEVGNPPQKIRYSVVVVVIGIFFLINSFFLFFQSWLGFKKFAEHM